MQIINQKNQAVLADKIDIADTALKRLVGLLKYKSMHSGQALVIKPCNAIHTFFMRFAIDVLFVDKENRIIQTIPGLQPWRLSGIYLTARLCIELPAGTLEAYRVFPGDTLSFLE